MTMSPDQAANRLQNLARRQYGPLLARLVSEPAEFQTALRETPWPADAVAATTLAGDLIRRGLLSLAEHLQGTLRGWTTYHRAGADLPEPTRTAWLLGEYLGLNAAEYERLTGQTAAEFEAALQDAQRQLREALQLGIDEERLEQELQAIHEEVWSPNFGVIPRPMIALVRDAVLVRMFGFGIPDLPTRRAYYLAFGRHYRKKRLGNCEGIIGPSYKLSKQVKAAARKERVRLVDYSAARQDLMKSEPFALAEECFTLREDAAFSPKAVAELVGKTPAEVEDLVSRYTDAIKQWIANRKENKGGE
jgi:DNA-directed RNA polymerase specialized sigma24 family protein